MSVIVVTGATGDAGRAVCRTLLSAGHLVVAVGTNADRLASVDASSRHVVELTSTEETLALAAAVRAEFGPADGVVHLVGGWRGGQAEADFDWLESRILRTLRQVTLAFHDDLGSAEHGRLVAIGSSTAAEPTWSNANYATVKTAADAWVRAVASGWRKAGRAAAVTVVVKAIGGDGTSPDTLADAILPLWSQPAAELNGARIDLVPSSKGSDS
ncbi:oxidoreductase [Frondihabitans sucicola]|uniref:Oxidoreductase n=1 Tax=Frondihabitans sucicola TaxID=1268041 RepID=A0ABM8GLY5_9MICO|nr:SDR family oxidoreductase [Frondihabitans sucicola]BDZ49425.1 oxidoreductase [Frondihabitans sucicola]